jgi:hypothetical protein
MLAIGVRRVEGRPGETAEGELEQENTRLRKAVAELTLDKLMLKETAKGNW